MIGTGCKIMKQRTETRTKSCADWPDHPDRWAWAVATRPGDDFTEGGPAAHWRPGTRKNIEAAYSRYLEFLARRFGRLPEVGAVEERLVHGDLRDFHRELVQLGLAPITIANTFIGISQAFRVMAPEADRSALLAALSRMMCRAHPSRDVDGRILPPTVILREAALMIREAESNCTRSPTLDEAVMFRTAALLTFGALCPLRAANMAMTIIGKHLVLEGNRGFVQFDAAELKGKRARKFPMPTELVGVLSRYLTRYRPVLLRDRCDTGYLWLSKWGNRMCPGTLSIVVATTMQRRTGKHFTMHCFRHSAASFVADVAPERARMAAGVLDHRKFRTTARHYIRGQQRNAFRTFHKAVKCAIRKRASIKCHGP